MPRCLFAAGCCLLVLCLAPAAQAQRDGLLQIDNDLHYFLARQHTAGLLPDAFLDHQPLSAYEARRYLDSLAVRVDRLSPSDQRMLARFRGERVRWPGASWIGERGPFYQNGEDFFSAEGEDFALQFSPLLYLSLGSAWQPEAPDRDTRVTTWQNLRGARVSGHIGRHVFFEARLEEVQQRPIRPSIDRATLPRERRVSYLDKNAEVTSQSVYDITRSMGVVGFRSKHFELRFGRDRNRWGPGLNSLLLSNYAPIYDQVQIRTTFWRLQYVSLYTAMEDGSARQGDTVPRKYGAFQHLALNLPARVRVELFQSVIHIPDTTSDGRRPGYGVQFLNPLIFYQQAGKEYDDLSNLHVGLGASWIVVPGLKAYGQFLLTEFIFGELFSGRGWWGNKWGLLTGVHLVNWPVNRLSVRAEYARIRPYTYSHYGPTNFTHYDDVLGHPAGQNAHDVSFRIRYALASRLTATQTFVYTLRGRDPDGQNFGGDPNKPYTTRVADYGVELLQGIRQQSLIAETNVSYELLPSLHLDASLLYESVDDDETGSDFYVQPFIAVRWGLPFSSLRF